ncbi:MAG: hypothetical protein H6620_05890 [Halobacteriovoraceae bacterium]|nr:hypothetical protein [Halobacteriovoraceae bacterium]
MKTTKILMGLLLFVNLSVFAGGNDNKIVIKGYYDYFSGEDTDDLITVELTKENISKAHIDHYFFEDEEYVEEVCYSGELKDAIRLVEIILENATGESWQTLGTPRVEDETIVYPYSYVDESGDNDGLEAIVPLCE